MSAKYKLISWNRQKRIYDTVLFAGIMFYLAVFIAAGLLWHPYVTMETLLIRGSATLAFFLLHLILSIGPLCRLHARFLPLLYNRRHMGVTMFLLALFHASLALFQFHAWGDLNPLVSLLVTNTRYASLADFPFEILGLLALVILFLMAATSHDFWLARLSPPVWKALHMMVYIAYGLLVLHVTLGVLQDETSPVLAGMMALGVVWVLGLHVLAAHKEKSVDEKAWVAAPDGFVEVCGVADIPEQRACVFSMSGERVAVFKYDGKISAVSNVCQHQNGPLGEGRIIAGCITCPWHGYQYLPESGASPPPFTEKIPTFNVKVKEGRVFVNSQPNAPGTRVEPALIS